MSEGSVLQALQGKRVGILGYGVNHHHLVPWLIAHGVSVTIRDQNAKVREAFEKDYSELATKVVWQIQDDIFAELTGFDVLFRSPSIPFNHPKLQHALQHGVMITSQTKLFFQLCPCEVIGVTGSKGKGTTSTLTANILKAGYTKGKVYLAGNIGLDPFSFLDDLVDGDLVVLELSSFQLADLHVSPQVAVVLNVVPEHLDHHGSYLDYLQAKANLLAHQRPNDLAIVFAGNPAMRPALDQVRGTLRYVTRHTPQRDAGWAENLDGKEVIFIHEGETLESIDITGRRLLGEHNLENIIPAVLVGLHYGVSPTVIRDTILDFKGLEHRLSEVGVYDGIAFYDDSIATTPEAVCVAMEAFPNRRIHLIVGGITKGQSFRQMAHEVARRATTVSFLPGPGTAEIEREIRRALKASGSACELLPHPGADVMASVISGILQRATSSDVVLLAPGTKSAPPFANYVERAQHFVAAVKRRFEEVS